MVSSISTKGRNTTSKETANNKSSSSERRPPNSACRSHQLMCEPTNQEVSGESGNRTSPVLGLHISGNRVYQGLTACNNRGRIFPHTFRHWISTSKEAGMKKTWMWCLVGLLSLGSAGWSLAQGTRSTEEAVVRLEQQWSEARRSCEQLAPLMADRVLITESDGKVTNKAEALE